MGAALAGPGAQGPPGPRCGKPWHGFFSPTRSAAIVGESPAEMLHAADPMGGTSDATAAAFPPA